MSRTRSLIAVLAVVALALPALFGATTAPEPREGVGDASAGLLGAELVVDDLDGVLGLLGVEVDAIDVGLLEALTTASTRDEPDARASFVPLRVGDERPHVLEAGPGERDSVAAFGHDTGLLDIAIGAGDVSAAAGEDGAEAVLAAVAASLDALGATGLDIAAGEVRSEVTGTGAAATQDLAVEDLLVGLGDILPRELLELLPIEVLLDLLAELPLGDVRTALQGALTDVEDLIAALNATDLSALDEVDTDVVDELLGLTAQLEVLQQERAQLEARLAELENLDAADLLGADLLAVPDILSDCNLSVTDLLNLGAIEACIASQILAVQADLSTVAGQIGTLQSQISGLIDVLDGDFGDLGELVALLHGLLGDLDDALGDLLDAVDDAIGAITGLALFEAGSLSLEIGAAADSTGGVTTLVCELSGLTVLGQSLGNHSCDGGVLGDDADAAVAGALTAIGDLLNALPGVSGAEGVHLALLPESFERVETADDGTVSAAAGAVLLELVVPSVTIDLDDAIDQLLDLDPLSLELLTGIAEIDDLVGEVVGLLDQELVADLLGTGGGLVGELEGLLADVLGEIDALLDLPVLDLALSTPSIGLVLDPVSEATFTAAAEEAPGGTDPDPTPVSTDDPDGTPQDPAVTTADPGTPELPKTGGGIALLGLLALMGAVGLRRAG